MKIYFPNESKQSIGGGWTFLRNIKKYFNAEKDIEIVDDVANSDIVFIIGATVIKGDQLHEWKAQGKKIVLRVDNVPKDSRNRGCGVSRLRKCAESADLIIYQSQWSKQYAMPLTQKDSVVIYNGADTDVFYPPKGNKPKDPYRYLFVKDKRFDEAAYYFQERYKQYVEAYLTIIGRFDANLVQHNFDFFNGEKVNYLGLIDDPSGMAEIMRSHDVLLFPGFADACPQTVVEALNCGLKIELVNEIGGTRELVQLSVDFLSLDRMGSEYKQQLERL